MLVGKTLFSGARWLYHWTHTTIRVYSELAGDEMKLLLETVMCLNLSALLLYNDCLVNLYSAVSNSFF